MRGLHEDAAKLTLKPIQPAETYNKKTGGSKMNRFSPAGDTFATYFAFHIRRGDFQYDDMRLSANEIFSNSIGFLNKSVTTLIYIATDEKNRSFFQPFTDSHFTVKFLDDYIHAAKKGTKKLNHNHIGMIEQIVGANAHTFIGTPLSYIVS